MWAPSTSASVMMMTLLVAQVLVAIARAGAAAERLQRGRRAAGSGAACRAPALATLRILPRSGRIAWVARSRACLAEPPAESPSTMKSSVPVAPRVRAIGELAGQAQLAGRGLARDLLLLAAAQPLLGPLDHPVEQLVGLLRARRRASGRRGRGSRSRRCAPASDASPAGPWSGPDEFRLADEDREHGAAATSSRRRR